MKTLLILAAGCLFSVAAMAADKNPSVTIKSKRNFVIVVDGQRFHNDNTIHLRNLHKGMHLIKVYERRRGFFGNQLRLVSTKRFMMRNSDLRISIDQFGRMDIDELRNGRGWGRNWKEDNDYDHDSDYDHDRRDRDRDRRY